MNKPELIQEIENKVKEFLPTLKLNNNIDNARESFFCSQSNETIVKVMTFSEQELLNAPIKTLLSNKIISERFSESTVQNRFVELYHKILSDEDEISNEVEKVVSYFINSPLYDYFIVSEIENIRIQDDNEYEFIDSTIKKLKEEDVPFNFESSLLTDHHDLRGKPVIFTKVKAGDTEKAKELALHNFLVSFNLLKLYANGFKPVLKGCLLSGNQSLISFNEQTKNLSCNMSRVGELPLNHAYLNQNLYDQLKDEGICELKKNNSISKVVKECLYWFGLGLGEVYPSARLINFVTILESVLKKKGEMTELKRTVAERGTILLYDKFEQRKEALSKLKKIYDTRSKVVHTGVLIDDKDLASLAGGYARAVLIKLIKKSKYFEGNFERFIDFIDEIKLGRVQNDTTN